MILPNLVLTTRVNQRWTYSGIDSPELCRDRQHFDSYPFTVEYAYNTRGFRDAEWPTSLDDLQEAIWCVGDSFTVGIGQPYHHIWPQVLQKAVNRRCVNISMDGASNDWIFRKTVEIQSAIQPRHLIVMWSYTARRELADNTLTDEERRMLGSADTEEQDAYHWLNLSKLVDALNPHIIQCTIPLFDNLVKLPIQKHWDDIKGIDWPACPQNLADFNLLPDWILTELESLHACRAEMQAQLQDNVFSEECLRAQEKINSEISYDIIHVNWNLDWARDHHHFDVLTSRWIVEQICQRLQQI